MPRSAGKPTRSPRPRALIVLVTCPNRKIGERIGHLLVQERLAACVNIVPNLTSIYRWEGKLCRNAEVLLVGKTRRTCLPALIRRVRSLHPYSMPEIIALPVVGGFVPYLSWVRDSTS